MTEDRDEIALRVALGRRRPAALPPGLAERLERIPLEVAPLRPLPARLAIAAAPWAAVAALLLLAVYAPALLVAPAARTAGSPAAWTAASPGGGLAEVGPFGFPWIPAIAAALLLVAVLTAASVARGRRPLSWVRQILRMTRATTPAWARLAAAAAFLAVLLGATIVAGAMGGDWDAIHAGSTAAPGPQAAEVVRDGGFVMKEGGNPDPWREESADRYVYRLDPGAPFSFVASIRNSTVLPVIVLGIEPGSPTSDLNYTGLGLPVDPASPSAADGQVAPFRPFTLAPGEEVPIVVAARAGSCADPTAPLMPVSVERPNGSTTFLGPGLRVIFEVAGWRVEDDIWPRADVTVTTRQECWPPVN